MTLQLRPLQFILIRTSPKRVLDPGYEMAQVLSYSINAQHHKTTALFKIHGRIHVNFKMFWYFAKTLLFPQLSFHTYKMSHAKKLNNGNSCFAVSFAAGKVKPLLSIYRLNFRIKNRF